MFCVKCGKGYEPSYEFCNHCGYPLPTETPGTHVEGPTFVPTPRAPPAESAPYAPFVSLVLGSALLISVAVFNVADWFARNRWEATIPTAVAMVAAVLLAHSA
jgi:hypothetical protein